MLKKINLRRLVVMIIGNVVLGVGIGLFKWSGMGNDPFSAMVMAMNEYFGIAYPHMLILLNCTIFVVEVLLGRKYIGLGTFVNWFLLGYVVAFTHDMLMHTAGAPQALPLQLLAMAAGVVVVSLGVSMYQTSDMGVSPYDSLAIIMTERLPVPYFWCRILTDGLCTVVCLLFGGLAGVGTLVSALGLGPVVHFFNRHVSRRLCGMAG